MYTMINPKQMSPWRTALLELMEQGALDPATLARDLCGWCSESSIKQFCQANDLPIREASQLDDDEETEDGG
jgi:tRNA(Ile)-lysidine synthase TilS/MesJ